MFGFRDRGSIKFSERKDFAFFAFFSARRRSRDAIPSTHSSYFSRLAIPLICPVDALTLGFDTARRLVFAHRSGADVVISLRAVHVASDPGGGGWERG